MVACCEENSLYIINNVIGDITPLVRHNVLLPNHEWWYRLILERHRSRQRELLSHMTEAIVHAGKRRKKRTNTSVWLLFPCPSALSYLFPRFPSPCFLSPCYMRTLFSCTLPLWLPFQWRPWEESRYGGGGGFCGMTDGSRDVLACHPHLAQRAALSLKSVWWASDGIGLLSSPAWECFFSLPTISEWFMPSPQVDPVLRRCVFGWI